MIEIDSTLSQLTSSLAERNISVAVAESCTGGLLSAYLNKLSGSSAWFECGFVTYSDIAKQSMLSVPADLIEEFGAVSQAVAIAMAEGALSHSRADYSIAITGFASASVQTPKTKVGLVWIACVKRDHGGCTQKHHLSGNREDIRKQACGQALGMLYHSIITYNPKASGRVAVRDGIRHARG